MSSSRPLSVSNTFHSRSGVLLHRYVPGHGHVWLWKLCVCACVHKCRHLVQYPLTLVLSILCPLSSLMESLQGQMHFHSSVAFFSASLLCFFSTFQLITGGQPGNKSFILLSGGQWWPGVLMRRTCESRFLWKGLTLPFNSTSAPHKTGKATARLVDYRSQSQMPSNDYLAMSKVQEHRSPLGSTFLSQRRPGKQIVLIEFDLISLHRSHTSIKGLFLWNTVDRPETHSSDSCLLFLLLCKTFRLSMRASCRWIGGKRLKWDFKWKAVRWGHCQSRKKCSHVNCGSFVQEALFRKELERKVMFANFTQLNHITHILQ